MSLGLQFLLLGSRLGHGYMSIQALETTWRYFLAQFDV